MDRGTIETVYLGCSLTASAAFTASLLMVRAKVRDNRQRLISELQHLFFPEKNEGDGQNAAFDYIKAKYGLDPTRSSNSGLPIAAPPPGDAPETTPATVPPAPLAPGGWALFAAAVPYMTLCALGFMTVFMPFGMLLDRPDELGLISDNLFFALLGKDTPADLRRAAAVFGAAALGGYLMTARQLLRAVQNYELTQLGFLLAAAYLAAGLIFAMMIHHVGDAAMGDVLGPRSFAGLLLVAFFVGYMPDFGMVTLARRAGLTLFKGTDEEALKLARVMPPEMLDGIDYEIRYRLAQAGIYDVQNLAVTNPLLLYVETPYTLYQAFDWVLQAQLATAVGAPRFAALKRCNIRTSLDLERALLTEDAPEDYVRAIGSVLLADCPGLAAPSADAVRHAAMVMLDDLHIHRMRALWRHIFDQVSGPDARLWLYRHAAGLVAGAPVAAAGPTPPGAG